MVGCGKTAMAASFARWQLETGADWEFVLSFSFEHLHSLAPICDRIEHELRDVVGADWPDDWQGLQSSERVQAIGTRLKQIRGLIIWDHFEGVAGLHAAAASAAWAPDSQEALRDFLLHLRGGQTKILIVSRRDERWLGDIYLRIELEGLDLVESQQLALNVLQDEQISAEDMRELQPYNDLLANLCGNPLAIQVILPNLKQRAPEALLQALQSCNGSVFDEIVQQELVQAVSASLLDSFFVLDDTLRKQLCILGLFRGVVSVGLLVTMFKIAKDPSHQPPALRDVDQDDWRVVLKVAASAGLVSSNVTIEGPESLRSHYYTLHPALSWILSPLWRETFPKHLEVLEFLYVVAYGGYAVGFGMDGLLVETQAAISVLSAEEDNMHHALRLAHQYGWWGHLGHLIQGLDRLLTLQGRLVEREQLFNRIAEDITDANNQPLPGRLTLWHVVLGRLAQFALDRGNLDTAEHIYKQLLSYAEQQDDHRRQSAMLHQLGLVARARYQFDQAERLYLRSLELSERCDDALGQAKSLHQLGIITQNARRLEEANQYYLRSLQITQNRDYKEMQDVEAVTLYQLGMLRSDQKRFDEAESYLNQSLIITKRVFDTPGEAATLNQLGFIAAVHGYYSRAEEFYKQSLAIKLELDDQDGIALSLHHLGIIAQAQE